jgi:hypothetical protein
MLVPLMAEALIKFINEFGIQIARILNGFCFSLAECRHDGCIVIEFVFLTFVG